MKTLLMAVCGIFIVSAFGANELIFVGDGKSGSLTNELNYAESKRHSSGSQYRVIPSRMCALHPGAEPFRSGDNPCRECLHGQQTGLDLLPCCSGCNRSH